MPYLYGTGPSTMNIVVLNTVTLLTAFSPLHVGVLIKNIVIAGASNGAGTSHFWRFAMFDKVPASDAEFAASVTQLLRNISSVNLQTFITTGNHARLVIPVNFVVESGRQIVGVRCDGDAGSTFTGYCGLDLGMP